MVKYPIPITLLEADAANAASGEGKEESSEWQ